jgi:hypothetical protein
MALTQKERPGLSATLTLITKPPIDLLSMFARISREQQLSLRDPKSAEAFSTKTAHFCEPMGLGGIILRVRVGP